MRPSDSMLFVELSNDNSLILINKHNTDVNAVVTKIGETASLMNVPMKSSDGVSFSNLVVGDKIIFQKGSESYRFDKDGNRIYVLDPQRVKLCLR